MTYVLALIFLAGAALIAYAGYEDHDPAAYLFAAALAACAALIAYHA